MMVMVPSAAMWMKARGESSALAGPCAEDQRDSKKPSARPPPASALACRNVRRFIERPPLLFLGGCTQSARFRGLMDCLKDARVSAATAEVAIHRGVDFGVRRMRRVRQQRSGRHDLARLAVAALSDVHLFPRDLNRMKSVGRQTFYGDDGLTDDGADRRHAGTQGAAVDVHRACAAYAHSAAVFGAFEVEDIAQDPEQRGVWRDIDGGDDVVDLDFQRHRTSLLASGLIAIL